MIYYNDIEVKDGYIFETVSVMHKTANKGEKVTITINPKSGFEVYTVIVKYDKENQIEVIKENSTNYTFIHPGKSMDILKAKQTEITEEVQSDTFPFADVPGRCMVKKSCRVCLRKRHNKRNRRKHILT